MALRKRPAIVGIPASIRRVNENDFHAVSVRYVEAVARFTGAEPVIVPAIGSHLDFEDLVQRVDGFFFTGCPSNVEPHHYDEPVNLTPDKRDPGRDATTLPLIRYALANAVPFFAICRGISGSQRSIGRQPASVAARSAGKMGPQRRQRQTARRTVRPQASRFIKTEWISCRSSRFVANRRQFASWSRYR